MGNKQDIRELKRLLKPGDTVYCMLEGEPSRSGMFRRISFKLARVGRVYGGGRKPYIHDITGYIARILGYRIDKRGGIGVSGCGMDMGFAVVYELGAALWPKGTSKPHGTRNGEPDRDGGYALKSTWL